MIFEASEMIFDHVPTGWSLPSALVWFAVVTAYAGQINLPIVPMVVMMLFGLLPAVAIVTAGWKSARKKRKPFPTFFTDSEIEAEHRRWNAGSLALKPAKDSRPWTRATVIPESSPAPIADKPAPKWSLELVRELEWRRFELLVENLFRHKGLRVESGGAGADGGIDMTLFDTDGKPMAIVQCKGWREKHVGVNIVRELYGVMASEHITQGLVFTCGEFSADAAKFAENKSIDLVNGKLLLELIDELTPGARAILLREITAGDYTTPTCPSCRVKLVRRKSARGEFWGCTNYPGCRTMIRGA